MQGDRAEAIPFIHYLNKQYLNSKSARSVPTKVTFECGLGMQCLKLQSHKVILLVFNNSLDSHQCVCMFTVLNCDMSIYG